MLKKVENIYQWRTFDPTITPHSRAIHERYKPSTVALAQEETLLGPTLLGWALAFPDEWQNGRTSAFYYVDPLHRRRGVGKALHDAIDELFPNAVEHPWDTASMAFFHAVANVTQEVE